MESVSNRARRFAALEPYVESAAIYDLLHTGAAIKDFAADSDEIHALIQERNPDARTLLDVACGTGLHLSHLRSWYDVSGVDRSPQMLAIARTRLGEGVALDIGDMRTFDLGRTFEVVTCLFSSIGYLTTERDLFSAFDRLAAHVAPRGVLIVDGWLRPDAWRDDYRTPPDYADDGEIEVVRMMHASREDRITRLDMHHLVHDADGIHHFVERHQSMLVATDRYVAAAAAAGMAAEVVVDYMPGRDRIVATQPS